MSNYYSNSLKFMKCGFTLIEFIIILNFLILS